MPESPHISVLVPIYNAEVHLRQCLESVLRQTLERIEIICINDGSADNSLRVIHEVVQSDKRVKIIDKPNTGYGDSLNKGIDASQGDFIAIIEADDYVDAAMFEDLFAIAGANNADIVKSDFVELYDTATRHANIIPIEDADRVITPYKRTNIFKAQPSIWSAIYRRDFLMQHNIRFLPTPGASFQDTSFNLKTLAMADRAWLTTRAYVHYRRDNDGSSIHSTDKVYCVRDEYEEFEQFIEKYPKRKEALAGFIQSLKFETYSWNMARLSGEAREVFYIYMRTTFQDLQKQGLLERNHFTPEDNELLTLLLDGNRDFITKSINQREEKYAFNDL